MKINLYYMFLFLISIFSCVEKIEKQDKVIAEIGDEKITFSDLEMSLVLNPQYAQRAPLSKVRKSQLDFLIQKKYYYLAARASGLKNDPAIKPKLKYIEEQETIKGYIQNKFLNTSGITELEVIQGMAKLKRQLKIQHLFVPEEKSANALKSRLDTGESFVDLASEIYNDEILRINGGEIGYISYGDLDPNIEETIYSMEVGEISGPVASNYGFHIIKVLEVRDNTSIDHLNYFSKQRYVSDVIRKRKADSKIREHLKELSKGEKIQINNRVIEALFKEIEEITGIKYKESGLLKPPIYNRELNNIRLGVEDILEEIICRFGDKKITTKDFLERLREMPPFHRPYLSTNKRLIQSIIDIVRNDLLLEEAYRENIQYMNDVQEKIEQEEKTFLATEYQKRLNSEYYKKGNPKDWLKLDKIFKESRNRNPAQINDNILFHDVSNPDSIWVDTAMPVFLKNRYVW